MTEPVIQCPHCLRSSESLLDSSPSRKRKWTAGSPDRAASVRQNQRRQAEAEMRGWSGCLLSAVESPLLRAHECFPTERAFL
jgi:hypothetical protein